MSVHLGESPFSWLPTSQTASNRDSDWGAFFLPNQSSNQPNSQTNQNQPLSQFSQPGQSHPLTESSSFNIFDSLSPPQYEDPVNQSINNSSLGPFTFSPNNFTPSPLASSALSQSLMARRIKTEQTQLPVIHQSSPDLGNSPLTNELLNPLMGSSPSSQSSSSINGSSFSSVDESDERSQGSHQSNQRSNFSSHHQTHSASCQVNGSPNSRSDAMGDMSNERYLSFAVIDFDNMTGSLSANEKSFAPTSMGEFSFRSIKQEKVDKDDASFDFVALREPLDDLVDEQRPLAPSHSFDRSLPAAPSNKLLRPHINTYDEDDQSVDTFDSQSDGLSEDGLNGSSNKQATSRSHREWRSSSAAPSNIHFNGQSYCQPNQSNQQFNLEEMTSCPLCSGSCVMSNMPEHVSQCFLKRHGILSASQPISQSLPDRSISGPPSHDPSRNIRRGSFVENDNGSGHNGFVSAEPQSDAGRSRSMDLTALKSVVNAMSPGHRARFVRSFRKLASRSSASVNSADANVLNLLFSPSSRRQLEGADLSEDPLSLTRSASCDDTFVHQQQQQRHQPYIEYGRPVDEQPVIYTAHPHSYPVMHFSIPSPQMMPIMMQPVAQATVIPHSIQSNINVVTAVEVNPATIVASTVDNGMPSMSPVMHFARPPFGTVIHEMRMPMPASPVHHGVHLARIIGTPLMRPGPPQQLPPAKKQKGKAGTPVQANAVLAHPTLAQAIAHPAHMQHYQVPFMQDRPVMAHSWV